MTVSHSPLPTFPTLKSKPVLNRRELVKAHVALLSIHSTTLGDRIYAVFNTIDGSTLGLWSDSQHPILRTLRVGDAVMLKRNAKGHLSLASQPTANANPIGMFNPLQRLWRLL